MRLEDITKAKSHMLHILMAASPLSDALALMDAHAIGSIVVVDIAGQTKGIVSQPEILKAFRAFGRNAFDCPLGDIMRRDHLAMDAAATAEDAMAMMTRDRVRHVLVLKDGARCVGIISLGDLVAAQLAEARMESRVLRDMARAAVAGRAG